MAKQLLACAAHALLLAESASVDGGEITDKGYINQRAVLTRRAAAVAKLEDDDCANGSVAQAEKQTQEKINRER